MALDEVQAFLELHADDLISFIDLEVAPHDEEELAHTLDAWFDDPSWRASGHRFVLLAMDGTGGLFCAWTDPDAPGRLPVVHLGSEGERGVLTPSPEAFVMALTRAPAPLEDDAGDARLVADQGWQIDAGDVEGQAEGKRALERYARAVTQRFGPVVELAAATRVPAEVQRRFRDCTASWSPHL